MMRSNGTSVTGASRFTWRGPPCAQTRPDRQTSRIAGFFMDESTSLGEQGHGISPIGMSAMEARRRYSRDYMWQQWMRRPQNVWLRRALFQIHLWTGIGLGVYVVAISITGSAIVFRNELYNWASKRPVVTVGEKKLDPQELRAKALSTHPGYKIANVWESRDPAQPTEVWMDRGSSRIQRFFDPYTGQDLGRSVAYTIKILSWCGDLHTNLFGGDI